MTVYSTLIVLLWSMNPQLLEYKKSDADDFHSSSSSLSVCDDGLSLNANRKLKVVNF